MRLMTTIYYGDDELRLTRPQTAVPNVNEKQDKVMCRLTVYYCCCCCSCGRLLLLSESLSRYCQTPQWFDCRKIGNFSFGTLFCLTIFNNTTKLYYYYWVTPIDFNKIGLLNLYEHQYIIMQVRNITLFKFVMYLQNVLNGFNSAIPYYLYYRIRLSRRYYFIYFPLCSKYFSFASINLHFFEVYINFYFIHYAYYTKLVKDFQKKIIAYLHFYFYFSIIFYIP